MIPDRYVWFGGLNGRPIEVYKEPMRITAVRRISKMALVEAKDVHVLVHDVIEEACREIAVTLEGAKRRFVHIPATPADHIRLGVRDRWPWLRRFIGPPRMIEFDIERLGGWS